jgi:hypothetical protein
MTVGADGAVLQLVTRCESADDFVERFARFTTDSDLVVPALAHASVGTTGRFTIRLKDQSVVMSGRCEVSEVMPIAAAPGTAAAQPGRALMRLRLVEMDARSSGIHLRLTARRAASDKPPSPPAPARTPPVRPLAIVRTPPPIPRAAVPAPSAAVPGPPPRLPPTHVTAVPAPLPVQKARALTLIGVPATLGLPGATAATAAAPPPAIDSNVSPALRPEARVPGAAFTLPANPLSDLDGADLASFVEFTLLEIESVDSAAIISSEPVHDVALPSARPTDRIERSRRIARRAGPYAACVVVGLLVGLLLRSGNGRAPVVAAPRPVAPSEIASPDVPTVTTTQTAPARRDCAASVTTKPAGAKVRWGDVELGTSPIERAPIACGSAIVAISRDRYSDVTRTVTAERGQGAIISERLSRPPAKLVVTSSPPNALIKLNKRRIGEAPRSIDAHRYQRVRVAASLPGYQPWTKTIYLSEADTTLDVTLAPSPKPPARRAPAGAASASARAR